MCGGQCVCVRERERKKIAWNIAREILLIDEVHEYEYDGHTETMQLTYWVFISFSFLFCFFHSFAELFFFLFWSHWNEALRFGITHRLTALTSIVSLLYTIIFSLVLRHPIAFRAYKHNNLIDAIYRIYCMGFHLNFSIAKCGNNFLNWVDRLRECVYVCWVSFLRWREWRVYVNFASILPHSFFSLHRCRRRRREVFFFLSFFLAMQLILPHHIRPPVNSRWCHR